jgi:glycosyltransferase involved in cell wall biosynthesis
LKRLSKSDSVNAELNSERERTKQLTAKLRKAKTELRRLERQRDSLEHQVNSILQSRFWRYTLPARKLVHTIKYIGRPERSKVGPVEYVEPVARRNISGQVTNKKSRDFGQGATEQAADNSKNLGQEISKLWPIKNRLYALGFTERALKDLQNLATDSSYPALQSRAAWQLSLWYADQYSEKGARQCLELLSVALQGENGLVRPRQVAILEAECQEVLGNLEAAHLAISRALELGPHADLFLARANLEASAPAKIEWINKALELHGIPKISFDASASRPLLDALRPGQDKQEQVEVSSGTKVSVIIPVYNAEDTIQTALDSVLSQTWTNLEVLIVDDCSIDDTVPVVEDYVRRDSRVQLIRTKLNGGPYVARNLALKTATGAFVTCHDADDWSHPEKIEEQARHLLKNPPAIGNTSQQARATSDLRFYRRGKPGFYILRNFSSFMFRREPVMDAIGYWDCVRFGADDELIRRVKKMFGEESVVDKQTGPLSFQRQSSSSLTGHEAFGYHGTLRGARKEYFESQTHFHDTSENLRYEFSQDGRPFPVPEPMWPAREAKKGERRHFDVILVSDFRLSGDTTSSNMEEIKAQTRMGLRTGLIQMSQYDLDPSRRINQKIREVLDGERVQMLVYGEKVSCDTLILRHPPILQEWQQFVPDVEAANVHVIVNQTPLSHYGDGGEPQYTISRCEEHLQRYFGKAGVWYPTGPVVREALYQHHKEELREITLADEDWPNIIDGNE